MYTLSQKSKKTLIGVKPNLVKVVEKAITITQVDFGVLEGVRTLELQKKYVAQGKSRTLDSKHLSGDAVDLVAYVNGKVSWEEDCYFAIAAAMQLAAIEYQVIVGWGGVWDTSLNKLSHNLDKEVKGYWTRFKAKNPKRVPFFDGPHFELRAQ
jgi:peptidoglycan L-alanyl-D-glutamate endopeptidase CwlK